MRKLIAQNLFLTFFPRYALESITLVLISLIIFLGQVYLERVNLLFQL